MKAISVIRVSVPFGVSALIFFLLFMRVDTGRVVSTLKNGETGLLILAVLISLSVNVFLGAVKWRRILIALGCRLPYREVLAIRTGCFPFKVLFPLKSNELVKALYLDRTGRLGFMPSVSSLMVDKFLNLLILLVLAGCGLLYVGTAGIALLVAVMVMILLVFLFFPFGREMGTRIIGRVHPRLEKMTRGFLSGFTAVSGREMITLSGYSLGFQLSEVCNTYILLKAVGVTVPGWALLIYVPVIKVINNLPITVLGLGTREAAMIFFFSRWGSPAALLSGSILVSLVEHILPVLAGFLFIHYFFQFFAMKKDLPLLKRESG